MPTVEQLAALHLAHRDVQAAVQRVQAVASELTAELAALSTLSVTVDAYDCLLAGTMLREMAVDRVTKGDAGVTTQSLLSIADALLALSNDTEIMVTAQALERRGET